MSNKKKKTKKELFHYTDCGLDYIYLFNGYEKHHHPEIGEGVSIHDIEGLHKAIASLIVKDCPVIRGQELRFLRSEFRLSQTQMGYLVGKDLRSIQRWEEERNFPIPTMADKLVRAMYLANQNDPRSFNELREILYRTQEKLENKENFKCKEITFSDTSDGWEAVAA